MYLDIYLIELNICLQKPAQTMVFYRSVPGCATDLLIVLDMFGAVINHLHHIY